MEIGMHVLPQAKQQNTCIVESKQKLCRPLIHIRSTSSFTFKRFWRTSKHIDPVTNLYFIGEVNSVMARSLALTFPFRGFPLWPRTYYHSTSQNCIPPVWDSVNTLPKDTWLLALEFGTTSRADPAVKLRRNSGPHSNEEEHFLLSFSIHRFRFSYIHFQRFFMLCVLSNTIAFSAFASSRCMIGIL